MDDLMVRMAEALRAWRNGNGSMVKVGFDRRQILFNETGRLLAEYDALKAQPSFGKSVSESGQKACADTEESVDAALTLLSDVARSRCEPHGSYHTCPGCTAVQRIWALRLSLTAASPSGHESCQSGSGE